MKIVFFSTLTNAQWGGSEILWFNYAQYLLKKNIEVFVFVKKWDTLNTNIEYLKKEGARIYFYNNGRSPSILKKISGKIAIKLAPQRSIFRQLFSLKPDAVYFNQSHSYDLGYFSKVDLLPIFKTKVPYFLICQNNTDYSFIPEANVRQNILKVYENAEKVYFVSKRNAETAKMVLCNDLPNATVISNSISIPRNEIDVLPFPNNDVIQFASVARLRCSHKGQNLLIHIFSQQKWLDRKWILNFYGEGEDTQYLKDLVAYFNLQNRIFFNGYVAEVKKIWMTNQLFILASFGEGLPLAMQEAMLCGRPVVGTDVGGNSELIIEDKTGWLASGATFKALDDALEKAWHKYNEWPAIGLNAYNFAKSSIDLHPEKTLHSHLLEIGIK